MSILKIKSKDLEVELSLDGNELTTVNAKTDAIDTHLAMALAALALNGYGGAELHDEESGRITIVGHPTEWSAKSLGLNKGIV